MPLIIERETKKKVHALLLLDASGSMEGVREEAIRNYNEQAGVILEEARKNDVDCDLSLVTFNQNPTMRQWRGDAESLVTLTDETYRPGGATALYDALGIFCTRLEGECSAEDAFLVTVITDGYENSSREYDATAIKTLVDRLQKANWTIALMGAKVELGAVCQDLGVLCSNARAFQPTAAGMRSMQVANNVVMSNYMAGVSSGSMASNSLYATPDSDHEKRWEEEKKKEK